MVIRPLHCWMAAALGRLSYVLHRACGHAVGWRTTRDPALCTGDIVCDDCGQVLWCRAHDPWRATSSGNGDTPPDHWGRAAAGPPPASLFDNLQHVLQLAAQCPAGPAGDDIRRAACELIEAHTLAQSNAGRRRMLKAIARVESRRWRGTARDDDPSALTTRRLADALRGEVRHAYPGTAARARS